MPRTTLTREERSERQMQARINRRDDRDYREFRRERMREIARENDARRAGHADQN